MGLTKVTYSMIEGALNNIVDFGADPTGTADSTTAIQAALDAGSVYIPDGTYLVSSVSVNDDNICIVGESKNAILKRKDLTYEPVIVADGVNYFNAYNFTIDGNKSNNPLTGYDPSGGGSTIVLQDRGDIVCRNGSYAVIENVVFLDSFTSPTLFYVMTSSVVNNCISIGHAREGFYIRSGYECVINGCYSRSQDGLAYSLIATGGESTDTWVHKHVISNNICYDSQAAFLTINTIGTEVCGNIVGKVLGLASTGPGIRLGHDIAGLSAERCRVYDNYIFDIDDVGSGGTGHGINIENGSKCEVYNNRVYGCNVGIGSSVTNNQSFVVRDNLAIECVSIGFNIYDATDAQIVGNIARSCPTGFSITAEDCYVSNNYVAYATTYGYSITATSGLNDNNVFDNNWSDSTTVNKWSVASPENHSYISNEYGANASNAVTISGATPSVAASNLFTVSNGSATNMTTLTNWQEGAIYTLFFADGNTTLKQAGSFRLKGGIDVTPSSSNIMQFLSRGSLFYEVSRSF